MSRLLDESEYPLIDYEIDDLVSFDHEGERLEGLVVRVYNTRELYHVEVDGQRYSVDRIDDRMKRAQPKTALDPS